MVFLEHSIKKFSGSSCMNTKSMKNVPLSMYASIFLAKSPTKFPFLNCSQTPMKKRKFNLQLCSQ